MGSAKELEQDCVSLHCHPATPLSPPKFSLRELGPLNVSIWGQTTLKYTSLLRPNLKILVGNDVNEREEWFINGIMIEIVKVFERATSNRNTCVLR